MMGARRGCFILWNESRISQVSSLALGEIIYRLILGYHLAVKWHIRAKGWMNRRVDIRGKSPAWSDRLLAHRKDIASRINDFL